MRSTSAKGPARAKPAAPPVATIKTAAGGKAEVAPLERRRSRGDLVPLVGGARKGPQRRRVADLAPGERVPDESRIVFRAGTLRLR